VTLLLKEIRHDPLLWLLALVPVVLVAQLLAPEAQTPLFVLSVAAILPLAALLSRATELVAAKTGDMIGGLPNATLGNLTELITALAALCAGQYVLVKASIAGAIFTNTLFMLGASFLLGGLRHHVQEYNRSSARLQAVLRRWSPRFSAADRLDLSVGVALGSQIALFVAPVLVLVSYVIGPMPMDLQFWRGAVAMMLISTMTASLVTNTGRSAWFFGALVVTVYIIFALTLYLLPHESSD
jgi:Ca2+:H+ antiporter